MVGRGYADPNAISNAGYAKFRSGSHDALIGVYDDAGNVIETHKQAGDFKEPLTNANKKPRHGEGVTADCEMLLIRDC